MSTNEQPKGVTWSRVQKNLSRIIRDCTPPILHGPLRLSEKESNELGKKAREQQNQAGSQVEFNLPVTPPVDLWPDFQETPVSILPRQIRKHLWAMPENEIIVLATICKLLQPKNIFEFGTFTGASTLAIAANSAHNASIYTLDIPPSDRKTHRTGVGSDIPFEFEIGQTFQGTDWASQINILTGDAKTLDTEPYKQQMDLVFVDADHTYSFVRNDTEKALEMIRPGGVILWHDYRWDDVSPECAGVTKWVNEFHEAHGHCHEVAGTRFAIYKQGGWHALEAAA